MLSILQLTQLLSILFQVYSRLLFASDQLRPFAILCLCRQWLPYQWQLCSSWKLWHDCNTFHIICKW